MITIEKAAIPADIMSDALAVAEHIAAGKPLPAEPARRVHERAERIRQEVLAKHGPQEIGVAAIRELRGELPEP